MATQMKSSGFAQGIYQTSTTKKHPIGMERHLADGRVFHYAKAAAALKASKVCSAGAPDSGWLYKACPVAAVGSRVLTLTVTAGGTLDENQLDGGLFIITIGATAGTAPDAYSYAIEGNAALAAAGTSLVIVLAEPLGVALTASMYFRIQPSPFAATTQATGATSNVAADILPVGWPLVNVASGSYYWSLTRGLVSSKIRPRKANPATLSLWVGAGLVLSASPGYLSPIKTSFNARNPVIASFAGLAVTASAYNRMAFPVIADLRI
jgi:hypothetical protein